MIGKIVLSCEPSVPTEEKIEYLILSLDEGSQHLCVTSVQCIAVDDNLRPYPLAYLVVQTRVNKRRTNLPPVQSGLHIRPSLTTVLFGLA